jgi:SAM-dependent methyltransferase
MAALARRRCAELPVLVVTERFEDAAAGNFPLLFSAQAWHWVDPARRWDVAADVLRPGGTIALFWNEDRFADPEVQAAADAAYAAHARINDWSTEPLREESLRNRWPATDLRTHPAFTDVATRLFRWERSLSRADYLAYLGTHSPVLRLDDATRGRLFEAIGAGLPDVVRLAEDTALYLATRA